MLRDLQHGLRMLMKNPGFTFIAIISIAIGVGANAAMFSVADGLVFRPLPVPRASEVVSILGQARDTGFGNRRLSYPDYLDLRDRSKSFAISSPIRSRSRASRIGRTSRRSARSGWRSAATSSTRWRCVRPRPYVPSRRGRGARTQTRRRTRSRRVARSSLRPTRRSSNKRITLGGVEFTVIGVAPEGFTGIDHDVQPAFYIPIAMYTAVQTGVQPDVLTRRDARILTVKGRLAAA